MQLAPEQIAKAHHPMACGYYALINLCRSRGVEPPSFARLSAAFLSYIKSDSLLARRSSNTTLYGLTPFDQLRLLTDFGFPALCCVAAIHPRSNAREMLSQFLQARCALIVNYTWQRPDGALIGHSVVADGCDHRGLQVLDSTAGFDDGSMIELEPRWTPAEIQRIEERRAARSHGTRRILPYARTATKSDPVGIHTFFLIAYPNSL